MRELAPMGLCRSHAAWQSSSLARRAIESIR
jgi:hypothetical protein